MVPVAAKNSMGTVFLSAGGEVPLETQPSSKHCLESKRPLPDSILWQLQRGYYESLGESAWNVDVPSFASSNAKLARDYARIIFHFLRDTYLPARSTAEEAGSGQTSAASTPPEGPCLIFEIGAGHGRFTYLLLRFLLEFQPYFVPLGLPERPFVYYFTDVAESNLDACRDHPDLKPFVDAGWLDFAIFDANEPPGPEELLAFARQHSPGAPSLGEVPTIVVCNYVLDTLVQEAFHFGDDGREVRRGLLSIFSPQEEPTFHDPTLNSRLSFAWDWEPCGDLVQPAEADDTARARPCADADAAGHGEAVLAVIRAYLDMCDKMTVVIPVGGFRMVQALQRLSGERLLMLCGDKGHQDMTEFFGWRPPHLAVHGSFSFMVNFDALRLFFEQQGGFAVHTPYIDGFQCGAYVLGPACRYPSLLSMLVDARTDFGPATMMLWSRQLGEKADALLHPHMVPPSQDVTVPLVKSVMALLRYGGHDPDLFWQFHSLILKQSSMPHLNPRGMKDLAVDLDLVYKNAYRMAGSDDRDLACAIGECLIRMGRTNQAAEYFQRSLEDHQPSLQSLLQLSFCLQSCGRIADAVRAAEEALELDPTSVAAEAQRRNLELYANSPGTVFIGGGRQTIERTGPLLTQDLRFRVKVVFAFSEEEARAMAAALEHVSQVLRITGQGVSSDALAAGAEGGDALRPEVVWGSEGLQGILARADITVCVVDVHHKMLLGLLPKLWAAQKHVLSHSPLAYDLDTARRLLALYQDLPPGVSRPAWHALESARFEDALTIAGESLERVGRPLCISMVTVIPQTAALRGSHVPLEEQMAIELVHGLVVAQRVTQDRLASISCQVGEQPPQAQPGEQAVPPPARREQVLAGHFVLSAPTARVAVTTGTFLVCRSGAEPRLELRLHCARGSLVLKRERSAWQLTVTDDHAGAFGRKSLERSVPCVGYRNSHDAFLKQVRTRGASGAQSVDISLEYALVDTAVLGSVLSSMHLNGRTMAFKYAS